MSSRQGEAHRKGQQSASSATQAPVARVYTNDELDDLEERNEENVTIDHLYFALDHVAGILEANNIPYALMGGFHMILRGFVSRTTNDVDLAVDAKPRPLLEILGQSARILLPRTQAVAGSGVARIFVLTGPDYGEDVPHLAVEVDLIISGNRGAPHQLADRTVSITTNTPVGQRTYNMLNLESIFQAKLGSFYQRESNNDYRDLEWMCVNLTDAVRQFSSRLDMERREFFAEAYSNHGEPEQYETIVGALSLS